MRLQRRKPPIVVADTKSNIADVVFFLEKYFYMFTCLSADPRVTNVYKSDKLSGMLPPDLI